MLAVLPFENLAGSEDDEYLADGLTAEILTLLGRLSPERLGVIARTSVVRYKKQPRTVREIARELQVDYVSARARVVRMEAGSRSGRSGFGLEFTLLDRDNRERIRRLIGGALR